jgi:hypothetical protein
MRCPSSQRASTVDAAIPLPSEADEELSPDGAWPLSFLEKVLFSQFDYSREKGLSQKARAESIAAGLFALNFESSSVVKLQSELDNPRPAVGCNLPKRGTKTGSVRI